MAKKRKNKRDIYTTAGRVDMREGGRVAKQVGGRAPVIDPETGKALQNQQVGEATIPTPTPAPTPAPAPVVAPTFTPEQMQNITGVNVGNFDKNVAIDRVREPVDTGSGQPRFPRIDAGNPKTFSDRITGPKLGDTFTISEPAKKLRSAKASQKEFEKERGARIVRTGEQAEAIARGEIPEGALPQIELDKVPTEGFDVETIQLAQQKGVTPEFVKQAGTESVKTLQDVTTITPPTDITPATMTAAQITQPAQVQAASGTISNQSLAQAAGVARVPTIEGVDVTIQEGAVTDRVVGTLSEEAKSIAAINAGSNLSRITRAKKQLANAGLSAEDIQDLGEDPLILEDRLADFSETERGLIEGLPQEALVSNQLDSLLTGIEEGQVPTWARPAVAQVEQMLAQRGLEASTVGRDALLNTIIQAAMPIAQSNAQAIQASVSQQKNIEAQEAERNAARVQQTALTNAAQVFQLNMAQFSADQQTALSNSKFLQTVSLTEATNDQQAIIQNAALMSQANLAEADFFQKSQIQNAQAFLQMDISNLNNQQQANVLKSQQDQQRLLSNQAADNAARQFNATSQNQTQQFMAGLNTQIQQYNATQMNASRQFNIQQQNAAEARRVQNVLAVNKANAAIANQVNQLNAQLDFNRNQWNAQNEQAVLQSNVSWRRQANLADTAAQNAINQQNAKNAFQLSSQAQAFLWQELRDQADYDFRWADSEASRKTQLLYAAISNESEAAKNWSTNLTQITNVIDDLFGGSG